MKLRLIVLLISACCLLSVSVLGITRGIRASAAYFLYNKAKYGSANDDAGAVLAKAATAQRFYPYNYYFCIWAAEKCYYEQFKPDSDRKYLLASVDYWCDQGLRQNQYKRELRMLRARLLAEDSPADAVEYWGQYLDWHYWDPFNHSAMAEFHAMAGDYDKAFEALEVIKGMKYYEEGLRRVKDQWNKEMAIPQIPE